MKKVFLRYHTHEPAWDWCTVTITFDCRPPKSNQFTLESKSMIVANLKKFFHGIFEISEEWWWMSGCGQMWWIDIMPLATAFSGKEAWKMYPFFLFDSRCTGLQPQTLWWHNSALQLVYWYLHYSFVYIKWSVNDTDGQPGSITNFIPTAAYSECITIPLSRLYLTL